MEDQHNHHHRLHMSPLLVGFLGIFAGAILAAICNCMILLCNNARGNNNNNNNISVDREPNYRAHTMVEHSAVQVVVSKYCKECKEDLCAICLGEFKVGEGVRVLPECTHLFHVVCIDKWLENHPNCPLCRANTILPSNFTTGLELDSGGGIMRMPE